MARSAKVNRPKDRSADLKQRIEDLEETANKTRLEVMRLAALLVTKLDNALAAMTVEVVNTGDLAVLQVQVASLIQKAEDLQTKIDHLRADEYEEAHSVKP